MTVHRASDRPSAPQVYQCKTTQSTGMVTQMQLNVLFRGKSHGRLDFQKEKITTKSCLLRRYFFMFTLTWIPEKELERVAENKGDEFPREKKHGN